MKTGITTSPSIASEELVKSTMGMSAKGMDIASYFLRDKIYSDKALACIREYICNAVDEHTKHNIQRPVDVLIKPDDDNNPMWSVRDYAKGLSEDGVRNIFGMYFESTKSGTNTMIGGFGIGSKAGHCYTDTFYVRSWFEGVCTLYACVLGGGSKGVPVGEIYKIDEQPTSESGIEISFNIKDSDTYSFSDKTAGFVAKFGNRAAIKFEDTYRKFVMSPSEPDLTHEDEGFVFNLYKTSSGAEIHSHVTNSRFYIRMGGVVYATVTCNYLVNGLIVVDVPIGKLTIPISREHLDTTPANNIVLDKIKTKIADLHKKESAETPKISMGAYLATCGPYENIPREWFTFSARETYPAESRIAYSFKMYDMGYSARPKFNANGKIVVYTVPDNKSKNAWIRRLSAHLTTVKGTDYAGFAYMYEHDKIKIVDNDKDNIDFSDFTFISIRKAGIPPIPRTKPDPNAVKRFTMYEGIRRLGLYTAEEFEEITAEKTDFEVYDKWWESTKTFDELHKRTVSYKAIPGSDTYSTQSVNMFNQLIELGWIDRRSTLYRDQVARIQGIVNERRKAIEATYRVSQLIKTNINPKAIERLSKKPSLLSRFDDLVNKIKREDSTRGRIITALHASYTQIPRNDIRKILKLTE
jgi:hypothetical protein